MTAMTSAVLWATSFPGYSDEESGARFLGRILKLF